MTDIIAHYTIPLPPITKKNSQRIIQAKGRPMIIPSKAYKDYEKNAAVYLQGDADPIDYPCEIRCIFWMPTRRRVDLTNLLEAVDDILVKSGVIADDNCKIIVSHDGSRVYYAKENPRTDITILGV